MRPTLNVCGAFAATALAASIHVIVRADGQLVPGRNVNLNPTVTDQFIGDIYRQRQVESKIACTIPYHCAAISNDYRTVDMTADAVSGLGEGNSANAVARAFGSLARVLRLNRPETRANPQALPDAWLGLYRTTNLEDWQNGLVPGFPQDIGNLAALMPWHGKSAASDGDLASDGTYIYGVGLFFDRGGTSMIGAFRLTDFNDESAMPIRWTANSQRVIDRRDVNANVQFVDLPSIAADPTPRGDAAPGCGHVYIGYTAFTGTSGASSIKFVRSMDCGNSYSAPVSLNVFPGTQIPVFQKNQRVVFAVNPKAGTPLTTGGGTVYAVWRTFSPDMIVGTASLDYGKTWLPPVAYSVFNGVNTLCAYDQPTVGSSNDLGLPGNDTARANAFPSITIDSNGKLYLVWTERVSAAGNPVNGNACKATLQPKIILTTSTTGGLLWTPRKAVDMGARCETTPAADGSRPGGLDESVPGGTIGTCPVGTVGRLSGPQVQPVISHNAGKVMLMYSEGRGPLNATPGPAFGFHSGRDSRMDVRAAQINPSTNALLSTTQVSIYSYDAATNDIKARDGAVNPPNSKAVNLPYLLQYTNGTNPFKGDHDGLAPGQPVVWDSPAHPPTAADMPETRFLGVWGGDNRESRFPGGNLFDTQGWTVYQDAVNFPNSCNAGIRNSNDYLSSIGSATEAFVHQSFKPTDTLQRTWVVTVRNRSNVTRVYKFALEEPGGNGSFDQSFDQVGGRGVNVIGNTDANPFCQSGAAYPTCTAYRRILPYSSMTFTVFGHVTNPAMGGPIRVDVFEAALSNNGPNATVTGTTLASIVRLNPNPNNPTASLADPSTATTESHDPSVIGPFVNTYPVPGPGNPGPGNPGPGNPGPGNQSPAFPGPGNPGPGNPGPGNPGPGNPGPGNAGFSDYSDYTYQVSAPGANTTSQFASFGDMPGNVDDSHFIQMIITRSHDVPTVGGDTACTPAVRPEDELVSLINLQSSSDLKVPGPGNPGPGNPGPGNTTAFNPGPGNPGPGNPGPGNPGPGNNTFAVAPANAPLAAGGAAMFRANALASASPTAISDQAADVGPDGTLTSLPGVDVVFVTFRFYHCRRPGGCDFNGRHYNPDTGETVPLTGGGGGNHLISLTTAPGSGDNNNGTIVPPQPVVTGADLLVVDEALTAVPNSGPAGTQTTINPFTIMNAGFASAGPFTIRYFLEPSVGSEIPLTGSIGLGEGFTGLAGGASIVVPAFARQVTIPEGTPDGFYLIRVKVDDTNAVHETDETNNFKDAAFTVAAPFVLASCVPSSSLSVLIQGSRVVSYVPKGSWSTSPTGIFWVPIEGAGASPFSISTPGVVNSCASNSQTGQTVCTANNTDVYLLNGSEADGSSPSSTLQSSGTGTAPFSGGTCTNCGVAIDSAANKAVLTLNTASGPGFQVLDLSGPTFAPAFASQSPSPFAGGFGRITEALVIDPIRTLVLSPGENGNYELVDLSGANPKFYQHTFPGAFFEADSAALDCTTGIALASHESDGKIFLADLNQVAFNDATHTWDTPAQQVQTLPEFGPPRIPGIAVAPGSHIGMVTSEFGGNGFGAIQLPATSGAEAGTPSVTDYVKCSVPTITIGQTGFGAWSMGLDPHTMTAYTSPNSGHAVGLMANDGTSYLAIVDLTALLAAPRTGAHTCDPSYDLVGNGVLRFISTAPIIP
jgi:hypothetical protein